MKKLFLIFVIIPISAFADDLILSNIQNGCLNTLNTDTFLLPTFTPNQYQCSSGYYLPAHTDHCVVCPEYYDCDGGIFYFNKNYSQGNVFKTRVTEDITNGCKKDFLRVYNNAANITATFTPNQHTCVAGYYLPANVDECRKCLNDHYCPGGQLTFNATNDQGIVACGTGLYAPTGMWESAQCGRILHIGENVVYLRATKKTTPSLNIDIDSDGTADYFGNMTTLDVPMTNGTQRKLKISFGGQTYSVYDDSVDLTEYQN